MEWGSWSAFWAMGGKAPFVWGSYFVTGALIAFEVLQLLLWSRRVAARVAAAAQWNAVDEASEPAKEPE
ncbi:heme exporter protein CcmD [Hydrogenophilus thiooxidans]|uniref:heme exporter protein CcmD n=1 Tax=Hydrogenophilus thiooxidans TaxID=2820326 RepID=UPI001C220E51|nr:heme exporter protein CcmD [Hydrogenophilus thiooxidans]